MFVVNEPYLLPAFFLFAFRQKLGTLCWMDLKIRTKTKSLRDTKYISSFLEVLTWEVIRLMSVL